jgi:hypothetical protein
VKKVAAVLLALTALGAAGMRPDIAAVELRPSA